MSVSAIRHGLGLNLATISGLRVGETVPDQVNPPIAIVSLQSVDYDGALHGGLTTYSFQITVVVGRVSDRTAQRDLDAFISPGSGSIKTAIESDRTLNGSAFDCRVEGLSSYGSVTLGDITFLAADFVVTVYGN